MMTPDLANYSKITCGFSLDVVGEAQTVFESVTTGESCVLSTSVFLSCCGGGITFDPDEISGFETLLSLAAFRTDNGLGFWSKSKESHRDYQKIT